MDFQVTPRAIIEILDAEGKISGYEIENHYVPDDELAKMGVAPQVRRDEATPEAVAALRKTSADTSVVNVQNANAQIAELQATFAANLKTAQDQIVNLQAQLAGANEGAQAGVALKAAIKQLMGG